MSVSPKELESELNALLKPDQFTDYCPNGLQLQGCSEIKKIVSGVTACQALIEAAAEGNADMLLVHHGYFWRGEDQTITGLKKNRIQSLLEHEISLFAYHLPLDAHKELGNNVQLARKLDFVVDGTLDKEAKNPIVFRGRLQKPQAFDDFMRFLAVRLEREPLGIAGSAEKISSIAWCTGGAQKYIEIAVEAGVDAYLTGEISEPTVHIARETGLHFFSAGHHATERYGVQAVGDYLARKFDILHEFIDIDNPA